MTVAALMFSPAPDSMRLPEEMRTEFAAMWERWWVPLRSDSIALRAQVDSPEEQVLLARFLHGLTVITSRYGDVIIPQLRPGFSQMFEDLVRAEESSAPTARRLGLRFLQRAVETLGELVETVVSSSTLNLQEVALPSFSTTNEHTVALLDEVSLVVLRLELSTFIAFDLAKAESTEAFVEWARRAHDAARSASPYIARLASLSSGESSEMASQVVLDAAEHRRLMKLVEHPPAPSSRLRGLLGGNSKT